MNTEGAEAVVHPAGTKIKAHFFSFSLRNEISLLVYIRAPRKCNLHHHHDGLAGCVQNLYIRGRKVNCFLLITSTMHSLCTVSRYKSVPMATVKCGFTKCPLRLLSDRNFPLNHFTKLKAINQMRVSCSGTHRDERLFVQSERTRRKYIRSWLIESLSL